MIDSTTSFELSKTRHVPGFQSLFFLTPDPTKTRKIHHLFLLYFIAFICPFHVQLSSALYGTKIARKCPRSCPDSETQDPGSERIVASSHDFKITPSKKNCHNASAPYRATAATALPESKFKDKTSLAKTTMTSTSNESLVNLSWLVSGHDIPPITNSRK